jgi:hypothetical protein
MADQAAQLRAETAQDQGRLAVAEDVMSAALRRSGPHAIELRHSLGQLLAKQGRVEEVRALYEQNWRALPARRARLPLRDRLAAQPPVPRSRIVFDP